MGSARILREYLELDENYPVPFSISHGVDMNHTTSCAMDVNGVEPIHWCYNRMIYERASKVKPTIKFPHPWLLLKSKQRVSSGSGILVVGPPPGKSNDAKLLECLNGLGIHSYDMLIKYRGEADDSQEFWKRNGVNFITAGPADDYFYERLFEILNKYEIVIGCTLSSALFFAASIDRKCELIQNYSYSAYDSPDYASLFDFNAKIPRDFSRLLCAKEYVLASKLACEVLGSEYFLSLAELKSILSKAIESTTRPVFFGHKTNSINQFFILLISTYFDKLSPIQFGWRAVLRKYFMSNLVSKIKTNEIDLWLNGVNAKNLQIEEVDYVRGVTELGSAAD
jgi:hypothetical protein